MDKIASVCVYMNKMAQTEQDDAWLVNETELGDITFIISL